MVKFVLWFGLAVLLISGLVVAGLIDPGSGGDQSGGRELEVPNGLVAVVEDVPDGAGNITRAEYQVAFRQAWKRAGLNSAPKEGDAKYETARDGAMNALLDDAWLTGEAAELGVSASDREIENQLASIKDTEFPDEKAYRDFLKESGFTEEQVLDRVRLQVLSRKIEEEIRTGAPRPTDGEIVEFYEGRKARFETPQGRVRPLSDVRADVEQQLIADLKQKALESFVEEYNSEWSSRTYCAEDLIIERCSNAPSDEPDDTFDPFGRARDQGR